MSDDQSTDQSQKTELPSQKKLRDAREKGQVAKSNEVNNWLMLFSAAMILMVFMPKVMTSMAVMMRGFLQNPHQINFDMENLGRLAHQVLSELSLIVLVPVLVLILAALAGPIIQTGILFTVEPIKPKLEKISLIKGLKRLFSLRAIVEFLKGLAKLTIIAVVGVVILLPYYNSIEHLVGVEIIYMLSELRFLALKLFIGVLSVLAVIAILDYTYQRHEHMKKLMMSRQELKEEYKQTEGDPLIKAKLRDLRMSKARQRMMAAVPEADVVITNPTHYAVALKYDPAEMDAPVLVAKGNDDVALRIRELAEEHDVTIVENPPLARTLYDTTDIDDIIPADQYQAVAEVISYVFGLKGKTIN